MSNIYFQTDNNYIIDELIDLAKTNYDSGDIINKEYINWQYNQNPFGKPIMTLTREVLKSEVVGQYLVIPIEYYVNGYLKPGSLSLNTLTREDYRGKGLFTQMALKTYETCANQNISFTVGYPNTQSFPGFVKKLNFNHVEDIPILIKPLKPFKIFFNKLLSKGVKHGGEIELTIIDDLSYLGFNFNSDIEKYKVFWDEYKKNKKVILNKSFEFMEWRYRKIPTRNYKIIKAEVNGKIHAIMVVRAENTLGSRTIIIMDFMVLNDEYSIQLGKKLLNYAVKEFKRNSIEMMTVLSQNNNIEHTILKKSNFYKIPKKILPQPIPYIVRINKDDENSKLLNELNNWQVGFCDYDIF